MRTVVIVEPHPLFRLGLRQLLSEAFPQVSVIDFDPLCLSEPLTASPEPCDLLLLSVEDASQVGTEAVSAVERFRPARMLLLAEDDRLPPERGCLPECISGTVRRSAPPEVLKASVSLVLAGGTCFPAQWSRSSAVAPAPVALPSTSSSATSTRYEPTRWFPQASISAPLSRSSAKEAEGHGIPEGMDSEFKAPIRPGSAAHRECQLLGLTPRQYEVLVLLARGYPMKKVGRALNISVATAKAHTETLYQRLDVHNRNAAVYAAVTRGATLGWARPPVAPAGAGSS